MVMTVVTPSLPSYSYSWCYPVPVVVTEMVMFWCLVHHYHWHFQGTVLAQEWVKEATLVLHTGLYAVVVVVVSHSQG